MKWNEAQLLTESTTNCTSEQVYTEYAIHRPIGNAWTDTFNHLLVTTIQWHNSMDWSMGLNMHNIWNWFYLDDFAYDFDAFKTNKNQWKQIRA